MRMRHIVVCGLPHSTIFFFSPHYLTNGTILENKKKVTELKMCVLIFCINFVWNISRSKTNRARHYQNVYWSSCIVPVIFVRFWWKLRSQNRFSKNPQISNFMKIRPVGAELSRADRRIDMMKIIVAVRNAPKNSPASFAMFVGLSASTRGPLPCLSVCPRALEVRCHVCRSVRQHSRSAAMSVCPSASTRGPLHGI